MARPITWIGRLSQIRRSVKNSVRSHYERHDIELLFALQPSAAQKLMALFSGPKVGRAKLVSREDLVRFLDGAAEADDVEEYCRGLRSQPPAPTRRKLRAFRRDDFDQVTLAALQGAMTLEPGRISITFDSLDQMLERLVLLALFVETPGAVEELAAVCEPGRAFDRDLRRESELADRQRIEEEIRRMDVELVDLLARMRARLHPQSAGQIMGS
jgi:hypothetical protein